MQNASDPSLETPKHGRKVCSIVRGIVADDKARLHAVCNDLEARMVDETHAKHLRLIATADIEGDVKTSHEALRVRLLGQWDTRFMQYYSQDRFELLASQGKVPAAKETSSTCFKRKNPCDRAPWFERRVQRKMKANEMNNERLDEVLDFIADDERVQ